MIAANRIAVDACFASGRFLLTLGRILANPFYLANSIGRSANYTEGERFMASKYESPSVKDLGSVPGLTQSSKPGIFFDFPGSSEGSNTQPAPGAPGTVS
jgi:hypothetical protein